MGAKDKKKWFLAGDDLFDDVAALRLHVKQ